MNINELNKLAEDSRYESWGAGIEHLRTCAEAAAPYYRFLNKVVAKYMPETVLECGVYLGIASAHMAIACNKTLVIGIDIVLHPNTRKYLDMFGNLYYYEGDTTSTITRSFVETALNGSKLGVLFLDSEHNGVTPWNEYMNYRQFFASECLVACDDILDPRMEEFWVKLPGEKVEAHYLHQAQYKDFPEPGFGYSIVRTNHA